MKFGWFLRGGLGTLSHPGGGTSPSESLGGEAADPARSNPPRSSYEGSLLV